MAAIGLSGVSIAACGAPDTSKPRQIAADRLPPGLVEAVEETTTTAPPVTVPAAVVRVWMVQDPGLVAVSRQVPSPVTVHAVVAALLAGSSPDDEPGVRSAWTTAEQVTEVSVTAGIAMIDLAEGFLELPAGEQLLAVGQMVLTLTDQPGIGQVQFQRDGERIRVPGADGTTLLRPVSRDDYTALVQ